MTTNLIGAVVDGLGEVRIVEVIKTRFSFLWNTNESYWLK